MRDDPLLALAAKLEDMLPAHAQEPPAGIAEALAETPQRLLEHAAVLLAERPPGTALVLFVDQLEELFTIAAARYRSAFLRLLVLAAADPRLRVLGSVDIHREAMMAAARWMLAAKLTSVLS
jgi:hypothetical protein